MKIFGSSSGHTPDSVSVSVQRVSDGTFQVHVHDVHGVPALARKNVLGAYRRAAVAVGLDVSPGLARSEMEHILSRQLGVRAVEWQQVRTDDDGDDVLYRLVLSPVCREVVC